MGDEGEWKTLLKSVKNKKITHKGRHLEVSINLFAFFEYLCFLHLFCFKDKNLFYFMANNLFILFSYLDIFV